MARNPYGYSDDIDSDIFESEDSQATGGPIGHHALDGTVCPECGIAHSTMGTQISGPMREVLQRLIDALPPEVVSKLTGIFTAITPPTAETVMSFLDFNIALECINIQGPVLRAVAETLNFGTSKPIAKDRISDLQTVYEWERQLISAYIALKCVNNHLEELKTSDRPNASALSQFMFDFLQDKIEFLVGEYRSTAERMSVKTDESLILYGVYSDDTSALVTSIMYDEIHNQYLHIMKQKTQLDIN